jgi:Zn-dependent peptidase ImmA (M78 family)
MDKAAIEAKAWDLLAGMWRQRDKLWPHGVPHPVDMIEPEVAAKMLDIDFNLAEDLGRFGYRGDTFETAGAMDRAKRTIHVSRRFSYEVRRFTAAHELGHFVLHTEQHMFRDRPRQSVVTNAKDPEEREADYFATCFLMPRRLLTHAFQSNFDTDIPLVLNDDVAFFLQPSNHRAVLEADGPLEFAALLAGAESYRNRAIVSLADQFRVSVKAMAIRIAELRLVEA